MKKANKNNDSVESCQVKEIGSDKLYLNYFITVKPMHFDAVQPCHLPAAIGPSWIHIIVAGFF